MLRCVGTESLRTVLIVVVEMVHRGCGILLDHVRLRVAKGKGKADMSKCAKGGGRVGRS